MGIHEHDINGTDRHLSFDCISGDSTTLELECRPSIADGLISGRIVIRNDRQTLATIELDQERIDRLRAFLREEAHE